MIIPASIHHSSDPTALLLLCAVGFCAGIGFFVYGFHLLQRRRLILDTPLSKIRSAPMGMVEITGLAVGPYTITAPVTERACYYYRTIAWEWKQQGKNKQWVKAADECMHLPFYLDDNTGRVLVDARGADLDLHRDFQQEFSDSFFTTKDPVPPSVRAFLTRHGVIANHPVKVEEFCIKPKNSLFVLGTLNDNFGLELSAVPVREDQSLVAITPNGISLSIGKVAFPGGIDDGEFKIGSLTQRIGISTEPSVHVIRLSSEPESPASSAMTQQQKIAAALVKAGISSPTAWSAAGINHESVHAGPVGDMISAEVPHSQNPTAGQTPTDPDAEIEGFKVRPPVVLRKGTNNKTFLISWKSQREIARSLGWKCALMIWGGPALALISLYFFLGIKALF